MPSQTKGSALRLYLRDEEVQSVKELAEVLEISQTEILSRIAAAGIRAIKEAGNRMPLPLKFQVYEEPVGDYRLNEKPTHKRK